jgi:hypothetical protein
VPTKYVLMDSATGTRIRHHIYTWSEGLRQREEYESLLGRQVRLEKRFVSRNREILVPVTRQSRRAEAFGRRLMCLSCPKFAGRHCSLECRPGDQRCVMR